MKEKIKYHWDENIKPALFFIIIGALMVVGMRIVDMLWPKIDGTVLICFASDLGKVDQCKPIDDLKK